MLDVCYEAHNYFLTLSWVSPLRLLEQKAKKWNTSDWVTFKQERSSLQRPRGPDLSTVGDCILVHGSFVLCPQMKDGTKALWALFQKGSSLSHGCSILMLRSPPQGLPQIPNLETYVSESGGYKLWHMAALVTFGEFSGKTPMTVLFQYF